MRRITWLGLWVALVVAIAGCTQAAAEPSPSPAGNGQGTTTAASPAASATATPSMLTSPAPDLTAPPSSTPEPTDTHEPTATAKPTPAPKAQPTPVPAAGTSSAIGQVVRSEDFTAKITSVDFHAALSPAPAAGKRYVSVGMTFTPRPGDDEEFEAEDWTLRASGTVYRPVRGLTTAETEVAAGHSLPARVTFLVPTSASHLVLVAEEQNPASGLPLS